MNYLFTKRKEEERKEKTGMGKNLHCPRRRNSTEFVKIPESIMGKAQEFRFVKGNSQHESSVKFQCLCYSCYKE